MNNDELRKRIAQELGYTVEPCDINIGMWDLHYPNTKTPSAGCYEKPEHCWGNAGEWDRLVDAALTLPLNEGDTWDIWQSENEGYRFWNVLVRDVEGEPITATMQIARDNLAEIISEAWLAYRAGQKPH